MRLEQFKRAVAILEKDAAEGARSRFIDAFIDTDRDFYKRKIANPSAVQ